VSEQTKDLQVVSLEVENFKRVKVARITPGKGLVVIAGRNAQGKSSVMDSISAALMGLAACPVDPIRHGEQSASIRLDLGEVVVTRKFTPSGTPSLTITNADGAKLSSPQKLLDSLLGSLTFDPLAFTRMKPREQFDALKAVVKVSADLDGIDRLRQQQYDERTEHNRNARSLKAQAEGITIPDDTPETPVDAGELVAQVEQAMAANEALQREEHRRRAEDRQVEEGKARVDRLRSELAQAEEDLRNLLAEQADRKALDAPIAIEPIKERLRNLQAINEAVKLRERKASLEVQAAEAQRLADNLTASMEALDEAKAAALAEAQFPVAGLSLGDGQVLLNGVPLEQASSAEQLRVSTALAMAANPKLKVVLIREGSLLDENGLLLVAEMAEEQGYQVWVERVDSSKSMGIVIEDGEVVADLQAAEA